MRVAIYVRVSTEDQAKHGYSLADQRRSCRQKAADMGANQVLEFADEGITGATLDRPGLSALRDAVRNGQIDVIIALDPDRIHRKLVNQLIVTEEVEKAGVRLEFINFTIENTPEGKMLYSIRGAVAEYEKEKIRDRTIRGKKQKARQGGMPMDFTAYGYTYSPDSGKVTVCTNEALVIRKMYEWWTTEDVGINTIARRLNDEGIPTKKRRAEWHRRTVEQMLTNPVYKGEWHYKEVVVPVPALVTAEIWQLAQNKKKAARRLYASQGRQDYLLSGIIDCGDCHQTMCGIYTNWWGIKERRYFCTKRWEGASQKGCKPAKYVLASYVEQIVWDRVCAWLHDPEALAKELIEASLSSKVEDMRAEMASIDRELLLLDKGRANVMGTLASGLIDLDEAVRANLARFKAQKDKLAQRRDELSRVLCDEEGMRLKVEELRLLASDTLDRLDDLEFAERKALVRALVAKVVVSGRPDIGGRRYRGITVTVVAKIPEPSDLSQIP